MPQRVTAGRVASARLAALGLEPRRFAGAVDPAGLAGVVAAHGGLQAQDLASGLWSLGIRTGATVEQILAALAAGTIVRSWPMRGTLHWVAAADVGWMCDLLAGPAIRAGERVLAREGLTPAIVERAGQLWAQALAGGGAMTRAQATATLTDHGIDGSGQRTYHLLVRHCQTGLLVQGPVGRSASGALEPTFVLAGEWIAAPARPERGEAMAMLATRYVTSHGPVTERDLAGWCDQPLRFVREAVDLSDGAVIAEPIGAATYLVPGGPHESAEVEQATGTHLLPGFDEWLLGYKDRRAQLSAEQEALVVPGGNGQFAATLVDRGACVGTWRRTVRRRRSGDTVAVAVTLFPGERASGRLTRATTLAADEYAAHLGLALSAVSVA